MREKLEKEFRLFIDDLEKRLQKVGIDLSKYPVDHICYRVSSDNLFLEMGSVFKNLSLLYTKRIYHERTFYCFFLRKPFVYNSLSFWTVELSEPGGSDDYNEGFQHIEIITNIKLEELSSSSEKVRVMSNISNGRTRLL
jgi:uncharacterized protein